MNPEEEGMRGFSSFLIVGMIENIQCLSSATSTRLNVSRDGMSEESGRNLFNHSSLSSLYSAMPFQLSAPLNTTTIEITRVSSSRYARSRSTRGSRNSAKYFRGFPYPLVAYLYPGI